MNYRIGEGVVAAHAEGQGADGGAGFVLLFRAQHRPGQCDGTFGVVNEGFVAERTGVGRELQHDVELRQQHDDYFGTFFLLFGFEHGRRRPD